MTYENSIERMKKLILPCKAPTPRDNPILQLSVNGKSVKQIAVELNLGTKIVEEIRRHIMEKIKIDNLVGLNYVILDCLTVV